VHSPPDLSFHSYGLRSADFLGMRNRDPACVMSEFVMIKRIAAMISAATCVGLIATFVLPISTIETAFATVHAVSKGDSAVDKPRDTSANQPRAQRCCDDFDVWFLNSTHSKGRAKHTARTKQHRVATFVAGNPASAQISPAKR
jgi:hypothetical protein